MTELTTNPAALIILEGLRTHGLSYLNADCGEYEDAFDSIRPPPSTTFVFNDDGTVLVQLFPGVAAVKLSHAAALHLYILVYRASATICRQSWAGFWPRISQLERTLVCDFAEANGSSLANLRFDIELFSWDIELPADFAAVNGSTRRKTLTPAIEGELTACYKAYYRSQVSPADIDAAWREAHPAIVELLKAQGQYAKLFENDACYDDALVADLVRQVLRTRGRDVVQECSDEDFDYMCRNDSWLFSGTAQTILDYRHP